MCDMTAPISRKKRYEGFERRIVLLGMVLVAAFGVLLARLWHMQVIHGPAYAREAEENRLYVERLRSPRGIIYGRNDGIVLADNRAACDIVLVPKECGDPGAAARRLAEILRIDAEDLLKRIKDNGRKPYQQVIVKQDVFKTDLIRVEELSYALPGVYTIVRPQRRYLYGKTGGHLLGYLAEIGPEELKQSTENVMGDLVGWAGLEMIYQSQLRGRDGQLCVSRYAQGTPQIRTDAHGTPYVVADDLGRKLETDYREDPIPGKPLRIVLDIGLQREAERLLEGEVGAIVALNAESGEVLAMASAPGYDPSVFVTAGQARQRIALLSDRKQKPMRSRCFQEVYPPGSTFKVMLAVAALEEGEIDRNTTFSCGGFFRLPGVSRPWRCWMHDRGGHGSVNVVDALAYSCDVFFYNVGLKLGPERINLWAARMGLGVPSGIDLPSEAVGIVDSPEAKRKRFQKLHPKEPSEWKWYPGNTVNLSIGQGAVAVTPLQNAIMMACIVNGGRLVRPYLNRDRGPSVSEPFISERTIAIVEEGMRKCVEKDVPPSGTGKEARIPGMIVLGKTGTAQAVGTQHYAQYKGKAREKDIPYELRDHALFVAGVLDRSPRLSVSVIIEHGLHGSSAAAPIARKVIEYFYAHHVPEADDPEEPSLDVAGTEGPSRG